MIIINVTNLLLPICQIYLTVQEITQSVGNVRSFLTDYNYLNPEKV